MKNTTFRNLDLFPSSGEKVGSTYSVESERANLNHWIHPIIITDPTELLPPTLSSEDGKRSRFRNVLFFRILEVGQSPKA
jgi:hypothetical protein